MGVLNRISGWFVSIAYYLVFKLYQFESGEVPGPHPDQAAQFLLTIFPFILMLISFFFSWFINFDKEGKTAPVSTTVAQE
jgi:GPH family glycoside/pentoside/hexuronide:cation symporter